MKRFVGLDRPAFYPDLAPIRTGLDHNGVLTKGNDPADDAAAGGDFIAYLQVVAHLLRFLLPFSLGTNQDKVHGNDDQQKGQELDHGDEPGKTISLLEKTVKLL